jgi:Cu/Ag efflux protein CusF
MKKRCILFIVYAVISTNLFTPGLSFIPSQEEAYAAEMKMGGKKMNHGKQGMKMEMATKGIFEGEGKIIAIVPKKTQIVVGHKEIKGFMKAMPMGMGYPVMSADLLKKVKAGDKVKFKIDAGMKKIIAIEVIK